MIGLVHPGTNLGRVFVTIGSLKVVPSKMLRIVPFGDFHIYFNLNSLTLASSGVIVAHLALHLYFFTALPASSVILSSVLSLS